VTGNNLSYPAIHTSTTGGASEAFSGTDFVWGCAQPDGDYPNTACVDADGAPLTPEECLASGGPCAGFLGVLEQIYGQKIAANVWGAETLGTEIGEAVTEISIPASYVDWGDNLESTTWNTNSIIRVETTPFADLSTLTFPYLTTESMLGYQMWHIFAQGPDEQWGVRVTNNGTAPYTYQTQYPIINTNKARLNITKVAGGVCPEDGSKPVNLDSLTWTTDGDGHGTWGGSEQLVLLYDIPYTVELNVGGKYVYGYNWQLRRDEKDGLEDKSGWWRLTFYTPDDPSSVVFSNSTITAAPPIPAAGPLPSIAAVIAAEEGDTGPLYKPVVKSTPNLTYLDICIAEQTGGGGSGGGGGNGPR